METNEPSARETEESVDAAVYVDDLADAGDYWLTITDASRVTRRQEITIRRWVAAGTLPVRRQRMGLNKRTRHVRASDLMTLTPIVDPTATISGGPANADLLSIPVQQAQIMTAQHDLIQQFAQLGDHVLELRRRLAEQQASHTANMAQLRDDMLHLLAQAQAQHETSISAVQMDLQHRHEELARQADEMARRCADEVTALGAVQAEQVHTMQGEVATVGDQVTQHATQLAAVQQDLTAQAARQRDVSQHHDHHMQQMQSDLVQCFHALRDMTASIASLHHLQEEQYATLQHAWQQQHIADEERYRDMEGRLSVMARRRPRHSLHERRI